MHDMRIFFYKHKNLSVDLESDYLLFKLFLNTLYGKFGERNRKLIRMEKYDYLNEYGRHEIIDGGQLIKLDYINFKAYTFETTKELTKHSFIAISSFIASYSRVYLYELFEKANKKYVIYTDTDSIFTKKRGYENLHNLINNEKIGFLK